MTKELDSYLRLFNNYQCRFKNITILIPLDLYEKYIQVIDNFAYSHNFIKYGESAETVIFRNWLD